jgi:hypothetical protein
MGAVPVRALKSPIASVAHEQERVTSALDFLFNLKTAVGCMCQRCCWGARQGATTRQARTCKEAQHRMAHQRRRWQVHGAVTPEVRLRKQRKDRVHAVCGKMTSGQLPFSGSTAIDCQ